jgi:hypothetical protein
MKRPRIVNQTMVLMSGKRLELRDDIHTAQGSNHF